MTISAQLQEALDEDDLSHLHMLHPDTKLKKARAPGTRGPVKARGAGSKGRSGIDGHGGDNPRVRF